MVRAGIATVSALALLVPVVGLVASCQPSLDQAVSIVTTTRVLAVRADPAENTPIPPGQPTFKALVAGPRGDETGATVRWAFCNARKPLAQLGPVNPECVEQSTGPDFMSLGSGFQVMGTIPDVACRNFGPNPPMSMEGGLPGRPVDPDPTGGYYQPVQVVASSADGESVAVFRTRLACGLAGGSGDQQATYGHGYHINTNPEVAALDIVGTGAMKLVPHTGGATNPVKAGQSVTFEVSWAKCPLTDACGDGICGPDESTTGCPADCTPLMGCTGAERYVNLDLVKNEIVDQRERISVSWFATAGSFASDTTGRDSSDTATTSDDVWTAPAQPPQQNPVILWVVLLDDRGGVGWAEYALDVR
jgi:hypothetical protein